MHEVQAEVPQIFQYAWLIIILPFIGVLVNLFSGKSRSEKTIGWTAVIFSGLAFAVALAVVIALGNLSEAERLAGVNVPGYTFFALGNARVEFGLHIDVLTSVMLMVVTLVGTLIHIYAIGYMHGDSRFQRFFIYLNLFMAMMLILVLANNYLMLFVGWEGVGLCSFLLIGFWFEKDANGNAAKKAMIANRVGDWGVLLAMFAMFVGIGTLQFTGVFDAAEAGKVAQPLAVLITLLLLIGVTGKSAQIPLYVWLPDAMAGPTPVSALIHAATMVTAGVYLIARSEPLYQLVPQVQGFIGLLGAVTAVFAGSIAIAQFDIKKVLAYSTVSQLGFMVAAVGMGAVAAGVFHLLTHAFFKALLFLGAGSVIHGVEHGHHHVTHEAHDDHGGHGAAHGDAPPTEEFDPQDMRNMGGLWHRMRTTSVVYIIGALALMGIFPLAGFWSKDEILYYASQQQTPLTLILLLVGAVLTAFYMTRQLIMVFFGKPKTEAAAHAQESPKIMTVPLMILAFFSLFTGFLGAALIGIEPLTTWLEGSAARHELDMPRALALAGLATLLAVISMVIAYFIYRPKAQKVGVDDPLRKLGFIFKLLNHKYWIDELYGRLFVKPYLWLSNFLAWVIDWRFWHDWFHERAIRDTFFKITDFLANPIDKLVIDGAVNGTGRLVARASGGLRKMQTGYVRSYALVMLMGVAFIVAWFTWMVLQGR
jgi:NADH-quinone oxidoreductase subunit L